MSLSSKSPPDHILYDVDVLAVYKPDDQPPTDQFPSPASLHPVTQDRLYSQLPKRVFRQVTHRLARSLEGIAISTTVPPALVQARPRVKSQWCLEISPNGEYLAVVQEGQIEIRAKETEFEVPYASYVSKRDAFPAWRRVAWSLDSKILAVSKSDGSIDIITPNAKAISSIIPGLKPNNNAGHANQTNQDADDEQSASSIFLEPVAFLAFIDPRRGSVRVPAVDGYDYYYELIVVTYDGILRSYLLNTTSTTTVDVDEASARDLQPGVTYSREGSPDPGFFVFYHKCSFRAWLTTVTCGAVDSKRGLLWLGGKPVANDKEDGESNPSVGCWVILPERPYYRKLGLEGTSDVLFDEISYRDQGEFGNIGILSRIRNIFSTLRKIYENYTNEVVHSMSLSPDNDRLLTVDFAGCVKIWVISSDHRHTIIEYSWNQSQLNYFARDKKFKSLSFSEFTSGLKELEEGEGDIRGIAGIDNGKVVSIAWWSIDSIILGYQHGSVIIFSYLKAKNILSDTPEIFKSCREITSRIENRVLLIEHEIKAIRARVHGENIVSYSRAQEEDDLVDGNDTESLLQRIASAIGNSLHYVTDTFLWNFESDSSSIRGKFITIPKRTFRLNRITKILPQELLYRKINTLEYDTALAIAETYNLDTDIIYQARWRDTEISEESIHECLDKIHNREWVITNCLDRIPNAPLPVCAEMIRLLLAYGLKQTDILDDILANVSYKDLALKLRKDPLECDPTLEETLRNLPLSEDQRNMCRYRHYFLHYLDRLRTFEDITSAKSRRDMALGVMYSSFDMGGWTPFVDYSSTFAEDYAIFRDIDIAAQAMDYAADEFFEGLLILFTRHGSETLPYRYTILEQIPETADPSAYEVFLSRVSSVNGEEAEECLWNEQPWREPDWVENPVLKQQFVVEEPAEREFDGIWLKPVSYPAKSSFITQWYYKRAHAIDAMSGQVDKALQLVRYGIRKNVQGLETLEENLDMLYKLVYECCPSLESVSTGTTLCEFEALSEAGIVEIFLRHTDEDRVVNDVQKFILPYLDLLPARRARMSSQSSSVICDHAFPASECEPMELLYKYILKSSTERLGVCCCLFEASAVTLAEDQRIISSSTDLARLILSCAYGNERTDQWDIITRMTNSLPTFDTSEDMDLSVEDKKDLGRLDTESLFSNLKTKNVYEIQVLINDLYIHLDVAKTLARYHIPVPLKWFFCSLEDRDLQKKLCIQLARVSNNDGLGYGERFSTINGWTTLLDDMLNIQKSVLNKIPSKEVVQDFISGLLYAGRFDYARKILLPENQETIFDLGLIEKIVIESSRELFDKAASGSRRSGYMKMAYECLQIVPISPATQAEMDFIEATEQLLERKLSHKLDMSLRPIHIRHEKDRLSLIERFLRADEKGYLDLENALELARKLGFRGDRVAELKVHVMVAKAALRNANYKYAFDVCMIIINETKAFENSIEGRKNPTLLRTMKDVTWRACLDVGRKKEMPDLENRKTLLAYALVNCTKENMLDILNDWRLVESENKEMMRRKAAEPKQESQKVKLVANVPAGEPVNRFVQAISSWLS